MFTNTDENALSGTINASHARVAVSVGDGASCSGESCSGGWNSAGGLVGSNVAGSIISQSSAQGTVTGGSYSSLGGLVVLCWRWPRLGGLVLACVVGVACGLAMRSFDA